MKVRFLGTGTVMPERGGGRSMACIALFSRTDKPDLLLDCGHGAPESLARAGVATGDTGTVLLTHNHMDHNSGFMPLVMGGLLAGRKDYRLYGPAGTREWWENACGCYPSIGEASVEIKEIGPWDELEITGEMGTTYRVKAAAAVHSMTALAYRINDKLIYTGDTEPCPGVASLCRDGDVLIHECSFPDFVAEEQGGITNHTHPESLGKWLKRYGIRPSKLVLTHLYPHCSGLEKEIVESVLRNSGMEDLEIVIARDSMEMEI